MPKPHRTVSRRLPPQKIAFSPGCNRELQPVSALDNIPSSLTGQAFRGTSASCRVMAAEKTLPIFDPMFTILAFFCRQQASWETL
jgi:hypothetical protein